MCICLARERERETAWDKAKRCLFFLESIVWSIWLSSTVFESGYLEDSGIQIPLSLAPPYPWVCPSFRKARQTLTLKESCTREGNRSKSTKFLTHFQTHTHKNLCLLESPPCRPEPLCTTSSQPIVLFPHHPCGDVVVASGEAVCASFSWVKRWLTGFWVLPYSQRRTGLLFPFLIIHLSCWNPYHSMGLVLLSPLPFLTGTHFIVFPLCLCLMWIMDPRLRKGASRHHEKCSRLIPTTRAETVMHEPLLITVSHSLADPLTGIFGPGG